MASFKQLEKDNWQVKFYCKDYQGNNKQHKKQGFRTKKEALLYANNYVALHDGASDVSISLLIDEYMKHKKINKINTQKNYNLIIKKIKNYFGNMPTSDITPKKLFDFLTSMVNIPTTQKRVKNFLNRVFKHATIYYGLPKNPLNSIEIETKTQQKAKNIWTLEEFNKFDEILKDNCNLKTRVLFNVLYFSGARIGEVTALMLEDIDYNNNTININKTRISHKTVNSPKNNTSNRIIALPQKTMDLLKSYTDTLPPKLKSFFLFSYQCYDRIILKNLIEKYNLKDIRLHDFRHSHASLLINRGVDIATISTRLGHANSQITLNTYAHLYKKNDENFKNLLNLL